MLFSGVMVVDTSDSPCESKHIKVNMNDTPRGIFILLLKLIFLKFYLEIFNNIKVESGIRSVKSVDI